MKVTESQGLSSNDDDDVDDDFNNMESKEIKDFAVMMAMPLMRKAMIMKMMRVVVTSATDDKGHDYEDDEDGSDFSHLDSRGND